MAATRRPARRRRPITPERGGGPGYLTHDNGMPANPRYLRENNFGISASEVEHFPRDRVFVAPEDGPSRHKDGYDVFPRTEQGPQ